MNRWINQNADTTVGGTLCDMCNKHVFYPHRVLAADAVCPQCETAICLRCATLGVEPPSTFDDVYEYQLATEDGKGLAFCGNCGDYGINYLNRYLSIVMGPEYKHLKPAIPKSYSIVLQTRIAALPDYMELSAKASDIFLAGYRGTIKLPHETGEIWGMPEKRAHGWLVTLGYPEDR